MDPEIADSAIDLLRHDDEDLSNYVIRVIVQKAEGFDAACNVLSLRAAARFVEGHLAFDAGLYGHSGDGPEVDPVARYTVPGLRQILDEVSA